MDEQLEKYRFGITLELDPSVYRFGTDTFLVVWIQTICKGAVSFLASQGVTLLDAGKNSYICAGIYDANIIRALLQDYWVQVGGICPE